MGCWSSCGKRRTCCSIPSVTLASAALVAGALLGGCGGTATGQLAGYVSTVAKGSPGHPATFYAFHGLLTVELLSGSKVVKRSRVWSGGEFHVTAPAGTYQLEVAGIPVCHGQATVKPQAETSAVVDCE